MRNSLSKLEEQNVQKYLDNQLIEYEQKIKEIGYQAWWLIGEQLYEAKEEVIKLTKDKRAPGFIDWCLRKFKFKERKVQRCIKAWNEKIKDLSLIWGNISPSLTTPIKDPPPLPEGKFDIIYADPPWQYEHPISNSRKIEKQYPTLSVEEISNYKDKTGRSVLDIFPDNAVLFLWATNPKLMEAIMVIYSWGFEYRTNMVWTKDKMGMGYYCRGKHELLLIARKGDYPMPEPSNRPESIIEAPRLEHSKKPEKAYKIIKTMYPKGRKVELFRRNKRPGWEGWGTEET